MIKEYTLEGKKNILNFFTFLSFLTVEVHVVNLTIIFFYNRRKSQKCGKQNLLKKV